MNYDLPTIWLLIFLCGAVFIAFVAWLILKSPAPFMDEPLDAKHFRSEKHGR